MHRSGTTFIGEILRRYDGTSIIHEPFNQEYGLADVPSVYPCDNDGAGEKSLQTIEKLLDGRARYVRHVHDDGPLKSLARWLTGGRTAIDVTQYRLRKRLGLSVLPVLKDPFQVLISRHLLVAGFGVLVVIRHPAAIWKSIRRMGWQLDPRRLGCQQLLLSDPVIQSLGDLDNAPEIVKFAALWRAIHRYVLETPQHDHLYILTHEQLCMTPESFGQEMERRFGLCSGPRVVEYMKQSMGSELVAVSGNKLHEFKRNSKDLARSWVGNIDEDEETMLRRVTGELVDKIYGDWYP
jgi:hypothetical protein